MTDGRPPGVARANAVRAGALARSLAGGGVREVVISPGSRSTPLTLAFAAESGVRCHTVLDERAASFFALGLARASAAPVALVCTSGTAAAHYLPAVIEATAAGLPLVVLSADRPPELHGCGANQTIEQDQLFAGHTRLFVDPGTVDLDAPESFEAGRMRTLAARALRAATGPKPGAVHLNLPFREPLWGPDIGELPAFEVSAQSPAGGRGPVATELALFETVRRGVIVVGPRNPRHDDELPTLAAELAAQLGWPILAEPASGLRDRSPSAERCLAGDLILRSEARRASLAPDLVLQFGAAPTSKALQRWLAREGQGRLVLVNEAGERKDPAYAARTLIECSPDRLCRALLERTLPAADATWLARWRAIDDELRSVLTTAMDTTPALESEAEALDVMLAGLPPGSFLHIGNSLPVRDLETFTAAAPRDIVVAAQRGASGIGGALATLAGEALAWSHGPAVLACGDLTFLHDLGGLAAARALLAGGRASATALVLDNGGGGIFDLLPIASGAGEAHQAAYRTHFLTPQPTALGPICEALGHRYHAVIDRAGLAAILAEELERPGLGVVHVSVDRERSLALRHERLGALGLDATLKPLVPAASQGAR